MAGGLKEPEGLEGFAVAWILRFHASRIAQGDFMRRSALVGMMFCLMDLGPYVDAAGRVNFAFANVCGEDSWMTLCVKSWPPGRDGPSFDSYIKTIEGGSTANITGGFWPEMEGYTWTEGGGQACP